MKIALDAGHGMNTPGKRTPCGMREWEFNSKVAEFVEDELKSYGVQTLRLDDVTGNIDVPLTTRTKKANDWKADVLISIHANAFGSGGWNAAHGIETYVYSTSPTEAMALAAYVQNRLIRATGRTNRGVKAANFHMLRESKMTSILAECGFMTNKEEAALLKSDAYRKKCAQAIVEGLVDQYKLKKVGAPKPQPAPTPTASIHTVAAGETLSGVAAKYNTTVKALADLNKISNVNLIRVGQKINLPGATAAAPKKAELKVGSKVKIKSAAKTYATGQLIPDWVKGKSYTIQQIESDRVLLKEIVSWVRKSDIE